MQGLVFTRTYSVDEKYMFTVKQSVENTTGAAVSLFPYGVVSRTGLPHVAGYYILHEGLIGYLGERRPAGESITASSTTYAASQASRDVASGWLGITDKYWARGADSERRARRSSRAS